MMVVHLADRGPGLGKDRLSVALATDRSRQMNGRLRHKSDIRLNSLGVGKVIYREASNTQIEEKQSSIRCCMRPLTAQSGKQTD